MDSAGSVKKKNKTSKRFIESSLNQFIQQYVTPAHHFDIQLAPWAQLLRSHYREIRQEWEEFERLLNQKGESGLHLYRNVFNPKHPWKNVYLMCFGNIDEFAAKQLPKTLKLLAQTPLVSAMFSIMPAGTYLRPHLGEFKGALRYHLTLESAPAEKEIPFPGIEGDAFFDGIQKEIAISGRCGPQEKTGCSSVPPVYLGVFNHGNTPLKHNMVTASNGTTRVEVLLHPHIEGEDLLFDDTYYHFVRNDGANRRVVLFADLPRTLDSFWALQAWLWCMNWLIAPHVAFSRSIMKVNMQATLEKGLQTQIIPWYRHWGFLRLKLLSFNVRFEL